MKIPTGTGGKMREIAFGQYYPVKSLVHALDSRAKMLLMILLVIFIFFIETYISYILLALFVAFTALISKIPVRALLKSVRGVIFLVFFIFAVNLVLHKGETVYGEWWVFSVSLEGIHFAAKMALRLILLVITTSLLSFTTAPTELTNGIESLLSPLKIFRFPVYDVATIMSTALRFIPNLIEETDKIIMAQKARGSGFDTGGPIKRIKAMLPILIPLFISAFRRADELADALDARCYNVSPKRTRMRQMKLGANDFIAFLVVGGLITFIMLDRYYFGGLDGLFLLLIAG